MSGNVEPDKGEGKEGEGSIPSTRSATMLDIYWLGIGILLGGQTINWNHGMEQGFWQFFIATLIAGSAFICLALCAAEMASMLPFAGGSYGYVRCALGPTAGFLVGCSETIKYILFVAGVVNDVSVLIIIAAALPKYCLPAVWLIFYAIAVPLLTVGGRPFWTMCMVLAVTTTLLFVMYSLEAIPYGNLYHHADGFTSGMMFLKHFAYSTCFFNGIDTITVTCTDAKEPNKAIPKAMVGTILSAYGMAIFLMLASASLPPSTWNLVHEEHPLSSGYEFVLGLTRREAALLALPGACANALGFAFAASRQIRSMAASGLFPKFLSKSFKSLQEPTPVAAMLFGLFVAYVVLLATYYTLAEFVDELFHMCMHASCAVYIALLCAYMIFYTRYSNLERNFVSPLGLFGAYYGITIFVLMFVCVAFFVDYTIWTCLKFMAVIFGTYLYYIFVAKHTEFFSKEEQAQFMKAYILNANSKKKKKKAKASIFSVRYWIIFIFHKGIQSSIASGSANPRAANLPKVGHASTAASASLARSGADYGHVADRKVDRVVESSQPLVEHRVSHSGRLVHNHMVAVYPGIVEADKAEDEDISVDTKKEDDSAEGRGVIETRPSQHVL